MLSPPPLRGGGAQPKWQLRTRVLSGLFVALFRHCGFLDFKSESLEGCFVEVSSVSNRVKVIVVLALGQK